MQGPKVAEVTGLHPYVAGKYMSQCKSFSGRDLRGIMEDAAEMEEAVKTGRLADTMCVELFIVKYSMKDRKEDCQKRRYRDMIACAGESARI